MCVKQLIVGVTEIYYTETPYNMSCFEEIQKEVSKYIQKIGYNPVAVPLIPITGCNGKNNES